MDNYIADLTRQIDMKLMGVELTEAEANEIIARIKTRVRRCGAYREYDDVGCYLPIGHDGNHKARPQVAAKQC